MGRPRLIKRYTSIPLDVAPEIDHPVYGKSRRQDLPCLWVRVGRPHGAKSPRFAAVVDSGSPYCIFRAEFAELLGINLKSCYEDSLGGVIAGSRGPIYFHKILLYVEMDWIITVVAGFCESLAVNGILGGHGFFDHFQIRFDQAVDPPEFEITKIERPN